MQGGWAFLDLEKSDEEDEDEEPSSEGFDPGSDAEDEEESSDDYSNEVSLHQTHLADVCTAVADIDCVRPVDR